ncbi:hypothetical protein, partial [Streptococcus pneumoniae]|uniref:hypothetical protein n=1 Tax=Streptococcus pneumoniae TaxID=1313 RepID=UPI0018B0DEC6
ANNVSESELQLRAAKGDETARAALDRMHKDKISTAVASRPVVNNMLPAVPEAAANLTGDDYLKTLAPARQQMIRAMALG